MQKYISFILGAFLIFTTAQAFAFDPPTKKNSKTQSSFGYEIASSTFQDAVYQSTDNRKVFIDFNEIPVNIKCIQVLNQNGDVFVKKNVYELPVNSLFEIDLSHFPSDNLVLEIQTFTDSRFMLLGGSN